MREVSVGDGFFSGNPLETLFGLGDATNIDMVRIEWPSGIVQTLNNVAVKQPLTVTEPTRAQAAGQIVAWGATDHSGQTYVPPDLSNVIAIAAGEFFSMALQSDGTVVAWGDGVTDLPPELTNVATIAAGSFSVFGQPDSHALALKADGTVIAWGGDQHGETDVPIDLTNAVAIACGGYHNLALRADGTVVAWGAGMTDSGGYDFGQSIVPADLTHAVAIAAGGYHSLALKADGSVLAWGTDFDGQTNVPTDLTNGVAIAAGFYYSLGLKTDGRVVAWGDNFSYVPADLINVVAIAAGDYHNLALRADGTVVAWGALGSTNNGNFADFGAPAGLSHVLAVDAGYSHSLALIGNGPPVLHAPMTNSKREANRFSCSISMQSGRVYALEYKDSLADNSWTTFPLVAGNGDALTLTDPTTSGNQRFYRVRRW